LIEIKAAIRDICKNEYRPGSPGPFSPRSTTIYPGAVRRNPAALFLLIGDPHLPQEDGGAAIGYVAATPQMGERLAMRRPCED
jgi:hypothetical protein